MPSAKVGKTYLAEDLSSTPLNHVWSSLATNTEDWDTNRRTHLACKNLQLIDVTLDVPTWGFSSLQAFSCGEKSSDQGIDAIIASDVKMLLMDPQGARMFRNENRCPL